MFIILLFELMKAFLNFIFIGLVSITLFSCQKELSIDTSLNGGDDNNNDTDQLQGNWKFVHLEANTEATVDASVLTERLTTITKYNTVTKNNTGTISFDGTNAKVNNLGYEFDTELTVTSYVNGIKDDEFKAPFKFPVQPINSTSKYQLIGSDSLYLPEGAFFAMPDGSGQTQGFSEPSGAKFSINGSTLVFTSNIATDTSFYEDYQGLDVLYNVSQKASAVMKFEKQ